MIDATAAAAIGAAVRARCSSCPSETSVTSRMPARTLRISLQALASQPPAPSAPRLSRRVALSPEGIAAPVRARGEEHGEEDKDHRAGDDQGGHEQAHAGAGALGEPAG